ncbi:Mitotic exit network component [Saxophila tyrrhenica]|uniref:Mitotic exit network component n=1 Tax=Saxophila tyrrhenica TaxID=1690608 RepID=A0AAV9PRS2_9PEZI|nr:Mitotic exit network component [Saxophila tyrrhenica]
MSSFINTMFVHYSPPQPYSQSPKPLPALHSNILAESESYIHFQPPASPQETYKSPLQRHLHNALTESHSFSNIPAPVRVENRTHEVQRGYRGLGHGIKDIAKQADLLTYSNNNARTRNAAFQPQKRAKGTNSWQLKQFAEATLGSGSLRKVVQLPEGEDRDEWLAVNVVDFYNQINLLYGAITEFCSPQSCPEMKATDEFEYLWHDPPAFPKPTRLPAPTYISHLLNWTSSHLSNPAVFPTQPGVPFPEGFEKTVKVLFKRLYRIYAHIYCHHYSVVRGLGLEAHLNTGFKHYVLFVEEFGLADEKGAKKGEWFGPLGELVESMLRSD